MNKYRAELSLPPLLSLEPLNLHFSEQVSILLHEKIPIFSFTFGKLQENLTENFKNQGIKLIGNATTVNEAKILEESGVDFVVAQGYEAGAHRGLHQMTDYKNCKIGLMALIPQIADKIKIPLIASGGIMDGRGLMAAVSLGAAAVQMGTAFMTTHEASTSKTHRETLLISKDEDTRMTRVFSGRWARGIKNRLLEELEHLNEDIPSFETQMALLKDIRTHASIQGNSDLMCL